jgi:putative phosphoribosyl transferase
VISAGPESLRIRLGELQLRGDLETAPGADGLVLFAHGSGSSRMSPRNRRVAAQLREAGLGTLLFDLLTEDEERADAATGRYRFDIALLSERLGAVTDWLIETRTAPTSLGYFGASTGAAAALAAAADRPGTIGAVVSRGGRPDLAGAALGRVRAPTLLIVGGDDSVVLELNERALEALRCTKELIVVPGAGHLFEEPGTLDAVARHAADWFARHLRKEDAVSAQ